ncbi:MAG: hemerythrin domain-containing protein [Deltaproteobacteria bacterium]|nr:hemerythrin domain-containing protein [Deltaproteobacteria bacterium]
MWIDLNEIDKSEPLNRNVQKNEGSKIYSPFDPPEEPLKKEDVSYESMHTLLTYFIDEHQEIRGHIHKFEQAVQDLRKEGFTKPIQACIRDFFECFDQKLIPHTKREEKFLFLKLHDCLIEIGEHSPGSPIQTGVTLLEEEHIGMIQMGALIFNFFGLSSRLKGQEAQLQVLDLAIEKATQLVESLRLHFLREDTVLFPLAQKHLKSHEMTTLLEKMSQTICDKNIL